MAGGRRKGTRAHKVNGAENSLLSFFSLGTRSLALACFVVFSTYVGSGRRRRRRPPAAKGNGVRREREKRNNSRALWKGGPLSQQDTIKKGWPGCFVGWWRRKEASRKQFVVRRKILFLEREKERGRG